MKKSHIPTLLTCLGGIGVVATAVTAVKATPKAELLLRKAEIEKGEELTTIEKIKTAGHVYIPSIAIGAGTLICIFGANSLNKRQQASLISAYTMLENSYKQYKRKTKELYGEDADVEIVESISKDEFPEEQEPIFPDEKVWFMDCRTLNFFKARIEEVLVKVTKEDGSEYYIINSPYDEVPDYGY